MENDSSNPIEQLVAEAKALSPDDRLRLVTRLWKSLPAEHQRALSSLLREDEIQEFFSPRDPFASLPILPRRPKGLRENELWKKLFDPANTSELYSAPKRFDLATIFVVTAAYSLLLGGLAMLDAIPVVMVGFSVLAAVVTGAQAYFQNTLNPRGVSIVAGMVVSTLFVWAGHVILRSYVAIPFTTFFFGLGCGSFVGYLMGTLVGGVFLVADELRGKLDPARPTDGEAPSTSPFSDSDDE